MRVECESCRELVVARFAIDGDAVRATCPACSGVMRVVQPAALAPASPAAGAAADALDASRCPKCGAVRAADATACAACGLAVDRIAAYLDARDAAVPDPVRDAWARAVEAWGDDARHDDVLRLVASHNAYAWAAGRYRTRGDDAVARRQLERLRRAAEATMLASATVRPDADTRPYRGAAGVLVGLVVVIVVGLLYAVVIRDHPSARARSAPSGAPGTPGSGGAIRPLVPGHPVSPSTIR